MSAMAEEKFNGPVVSTTGVTVTMETTMADIQKHVDNDHASATSKYVKAIVYGGVDGVVNTVSVMAIAVGASLGLRVIVLVGIATVFSDAISMASSDWLSSRSKREFYVQQVQTSEKRLAADRTKELDELVGLYCDDGLAPEDAKRFVEILAMENHHKILFKHVLLQKLGLDEPDSAENVNISAAYTAGSVILFGSLPVLVYLLFLISGSEEKVYIHLIAFTVCATGLCACGILGAHVTNASKLHNALVNLANGLGAIVLGYLSGMLLNVILGDDAEDD